MPVSCVKKIRPEWIPLAYASPESFDKQGDVVRMKQNNTTQVAQIVRSHKKKIK